MLRARLKTEAELGIVTLLFSCTLRLLPNPNTPKRLWMRLGSVLAAPTLLPDTTRLAATGVGGTSSPRSRFLALVRGV